MYRILILYFYWFYTIHNYYNILTKFLMQYITFLWLIYSISGSLQLLYFIPSSSHFLSNNQYLFFIKFCICEFICYSLYLLICFFFQITYISKTYAFCLSLTYFTKHNNFQFHPCCHKWKDFILCYVWVIFIYIICFTSFLSIYLPMGI